MSISVKELVPIVAAATIWGPLWSGSHVLFHCDNEAVITVLQNRNAHETTLVQLLQCLFFYSARFQFHFSATHIPSVHNVVADAISRNSCNLLSSLIPQAQQIGVPVSVAAFLLSLPDWGSQDWISQFVLSLPTVCIQTLSKAKGRDWPIISVTHTLFKPSLFSESVLCRFVASLVNGGMSYPTIRL